MRMKRHIIKKLLSDVGGKGMLEIMTGEASKGYKKKLLKQNVQKHLISMH